MQEFSRCGTRMCRPLFVSGVVVALLVSISCKTVPSKESPAVAATSLTTQTKAKKKKTKPPAKTQLTKGQEHFILKELWAGTILREKGDEEAARTHFQRIVDILPDSPYVLIQLAKSYLATEDFNRASEFAQKAIEADPTKTAAYEILAKVYAGKQEWTKAAEEYQKILELTPYSVSALNQMAEMQARGGQIDQAIGTYRKLIGVDPGRSGLYYYYISSILTAARRYPEAIDAYLEILKEYPDQFDAYLQVGQLYEELGKIDEAIALYLRALKQGPNPETETVFRRQLAVLYLTRGSRSEAYAQYARIRQLAPKDTNTLSAMARLLAQDKEYDRALALVDESLSIQPGDVDTVLLKCEILSRKKAWKESADLFLNTLRSAVHATGLNQSKLQRANHIVEAVLKRRIRALLDRAGKVNELETTLHEGIKTLPDSPYFPLALLIVRVEAEKADADLSEDIERVLDRWDAALAQKDRKTYTLYLAALYENGTLTYLSKNAASPVVADILVRASKTFDNDAVSPLVLSIFQFNDGDWANAEKTLQMVMQRTAPADPKHQEALQRLALAYEKLKRVDDAIGVIKKLIQVTPERANGYNMLGYLYADNNRNLSEAETLVKKALDLSPKDGNIVDSLGWVYYRQGRYQEALDTLLEARKKSKQEHPVICDHLGDAYRATGHIHQAVEMWRKALEVGPQFPFDFTPEFKRSLEEKIRSAEQELTP